MIGRAARDALVDALGDRVRFDVPMARITSLRVGGPADAVATPTDRAELAALMRTNINVQELTVEAILIGEREHVYHAAMLDPHTAAELSLEQITSLVDDLLEAHGAWIPESLRPNP